MPVVEVRLDPVRPDEKSSHPEVMEANFLTPSLYLSPSLFGEGCGPRACRGVTHTNHTHKDANN